MTCDRTVDEKTVNEYLNITELSGITASHKKEIQRFLTNYLDAVNWEIDKEKSIAYCKDLISTVSISYYRKQMYQIKKFLTRIGFDFMDCIKLPSEPVHQPIHIDFNDIGRTIDYFHDSEHFKQVYALIMLGADTGARAEELYQLKPCDIDIEKRVIQINHNPVSGQTTKTKRSRVSFFTEETQKVLIEYLKFYNNGCNYSRLFPQTTITRLFRDAPIKVKFLRKYFSQTWTRNNGNNAVKKLLMGHSTRNDVDLQHYNTQSMDELK